MAAAAPVALAMQAVGGLIQGVEANRGWRWQAQVDEENSRVTVLEAEQRALQTRKDERQQTGAMLAAMGDSGVELGSGSAFDVVADSAYQRELEILNIRTQAGREADDLRRQAAERRKAGRAALIGGAFGVAAGALQGAADLRAQRTLSAQAGRERAARRVPPIRLATGAASGRIGPW